MAVMRNQIPTGLQGILLASQLKHSALTGDASLDEVLGWIQSWHRFFRQQQQDERPDSDAPTDTTGYPRCYRWWTPAVEASATPISHIVGLSQQCVGQAPGFVLFSLRITSSRRSAGSTNDNTAPIQDQEAQPNCLAEAFVVLEGLWLYRAAWNDERGWLEPATVWRPLPVALVGTRNLPVVGPSQTANNDSIATATEPERSPSTTPPSDEGGGCRPRLVPLLRAGTSRSGAPKYLAQWEIRASPALSALTMPYLSTHW